MSDRISLFTFKDDVLSLDAAQSADGLKLFCELKCEKGQVGVTAAKLEEVLLKHGIDADAIDKGALQQIAEYARQAGFAKARRVANGTAPVPGVSGEIVWLARPFLDPETCTANLALNRFFENIEIDRVVARVYEPQAGSNGKDIFGKVLKAPEPASLKVTFDRSLEKVDCQGFYEIVARKSGFLDLQGTYSLAIRNAMSLARATDETTGAIDFIGSISVDEDVVSLELLKAAGGISVGGSVQDSRIEAGDSLLVKGACVGSMSEAVFSGSERGADNIKADNAQLVVTGKARFDLLQSVVGNFSDTLYVEREIRDSRIKVCGELQASSSHVYNSHIVLEGNAVFGTLGNEAGSKVLVNMPVHGMNAELKETLDQLGKLVEIRRVLQSHLGPMVDKPEIMNTLRGTHREKVKILFDKLKVVSDSLQHYQARRTELEAELKKERHTVKILDTMFPNTLVCCEGAGFSVRTPKRGPFSLIWMESEARLEVV